MTTIPYDEQVDLIGFSKDLLSGQDILSLKIILNTGLLIRELPYGTIEDKTLLNYKLAIYFSTSTALDIRPFGKLSYRLQTNMPSICIYESDSFKNFSSQFVLTSFDEKPTNHEIYHDITGWNHLEDYYDFYIRHIMLKNQDKTYRYKNNQGEFKYTTLDFKELLEEFKKDILGKIEIITRSDNYFNFSQFPSSLPFDAHKIHCLKTKHFFHEQLKNKDHDSELRKI